MSLAILQARMLSTRLPGKVLKPILGNPMLSLQIERIQRSGNIKQLIVATSTDGSDDDIELLCKTLKVPCFRGSLHDVLDRFYRAAETYRPEHVVRLTGDCPLMDPEVLDAVIDLHLKGEFDYTSNTIRPTFPDGLDVEVMKFSALEIAWRDAKLPSEREHVTPFIHRHPEIFNLGLYQNTRDLSSFRWTVDEPEDFEFVLQVYEMLYPQNEAFTSQDVFKLLEENPQMLEKNRRITRNEGLQKSAEADRRFLQEQVSKQ